MKYAMSLDAGAHPQSLCIYNNNVYIRIIIMKVQMIIVVILSSCILSDLCL